MFLDSTLQRLYVANYSDNSVWIFDTNTATLGTNPQPIAKVTVDGSPLTMAAVAGGTKVYVLNQNVTTGCSDEASSGRVSIINTSSNTKVGCITVAADPSWIAISSDAAKVLVPHKGGTTPGTQVISTSTNRITDVPAPLVDPNGDTSGPRMSPVFVLGL
jgi:DNA-binding beta-propeller fold protein YncE